MKHWVTFLWVFLIIVFFIVAYSISNDPYSRVLRDDDFLGEDNASIIIVECGDYLDPVSRQSENSMKRLRMDYDVKFIYKHFVKSNQSKLAAIGSECANNQKYFEEMHNRLYSFNGNFGKNSLYEMADEIIGLRIEEFKQCVETNIFEIEIEKDFGLGEKLEVSYLPVVFINGKKFEGLQGYAAYQNAIRNA